MRFASFLIVFKRAFHLINTSEKVSSRLATANKSLRYTGLGNCSRALHVLEGGYTAAIAGAFIGNAAIPLGAHSVRFKPGVSYL